MTVGAEAMGNVQGQHAYGDVDILHHVGIIAADVEAVVDQYERLGFVFTPLSLHRIAVAPGAEPVPFGTGNRCAIFRNNYLEVLGVVDRERWARVGKAGRGPFDLDARLRLYEGLHIMHFGTDDVDAVRARLIAQGMAVSDVAHLERPVETPEGERTMRGKSVHVPDEANPEALIQIAQHVTPELVLQPRFMNHPNGARSITEVIVCGADSDALAAKYARYSGHPAERRGALRVVDLGRSRVVVVAPGHLGDVVPGAVPPVLPFLTGFTVATDDLETTRLALAAGSVPYCEHGGRLIVDPRDACGSAVLFEAEGAAC